MAKKVATLAISNAAKMSPAGRKIVADWLRDQAEKLENEGEDYAPRFTSHYEAG